MANKPFKARLEKAMLSGSFVQSMNLHTPRERIKLPTALMSYRLDADSCSQGRPASDTGPDSADLGAGGDTEVKRKIQKTGRDDYGAQTLVRESGRRQSQALSCHVDVEEREVSARILFVRKHSHDTGCSCYLET